MIQFEANEVKSALPQRAKFGRADLTYTLSSGVSEDVFAFRYENVKSHLSFSKKQFANAAAFGKLGATNVRKTIGNSHDKCTVVYLRCLSDDVRAEMIEG